MRRMPLGVSPLRAGEDWPAAPPSGPRRLTVTGATVTVTPTGARA
jgi:hypothetical protein